MDSKLLIEAVMETLPHRYPFLLVDRVVSFKKNKEAKIHAEALEELGQSVDIALSPQVVEFEEKTQELTGDAKEQFTKWRVFLKEIYAVEKTPEVQL